MASTQWDSLAVGDPLPDTAERTALDAPCEAGSPEGWVCVRPAGHQGRHVAAVDPHHGRAVAVWSDAENFTFPSAASYLPWNLHNPLRNRIAQSPHSGSRASMRRGRTSG